MNTQRLKPIPEKKVNAVQTLVGEMKNSRTILLASIKDLPSSQLQEMKKQLRKNATILIPKKNIMKRAIETSGKGALLALKDHVQENMAVLFSEMDAFELASLLADKKVPSKAKAGQEAPEDLSVEPGPTDMLPGPAMTDFGVLGIKIAIEAGKIAIKEEKKLVSKGQKITQPVADMLSKLDIKPIMSGLEPLVAYDIKEEKIYTSIKIDKKVTLEDLKLDFIKALAFAVSIEYPVSETITYLFQKAIIYERALDSKYNDQTKSEENS